MLCAQPVPANPVPVGGRFRGKIPNQQFNQDCYKPSHLPPFDSSFPDETTVYMREKGKRSAKPKYCGACRIFPWSQIPGCCGNVTVGWEAALGEDGGRRVPAV